MSLRTGLADILAPDETSRRAFEETIADWRDEWKAASYPTARIRASARGWLAIAHVLASTLRGGLIRPDTWVALAWTLITAMGLSLVLVLAIWSYTDWPSSLATFAVAVTLVMPQCIVTMLSPAAAIGFGTSRRDLPRVIAIVPVLLVTMVLLVGWVVPETNQMYRQYTAAQFASAAGGAVPDNARPWLLTRGMPETTGPQLIRLALDDQSPRRREATAQLVMRLGLVVSLPVFFVFGVAVRRRLAGTTRWAISRFLAGASAIGVFLLSSLLVAQLRLTFPAVATWPEARSLSVWIATLALVVATLVLARTRNPERRTPNQTPEP